MVREDPYTDHKVMIGSHLAIVEKFRTKKRECISFFSDKQLTGPNSYYFGVLDQKRKKIELTRLQIKKLAESRVVGEKLLAAWFSSTLFLALYLYYRREISGDYGRIRIRDMSSFPCINPSKVTANEKKNIFEEFDKIRFRQLPTIYEQLHGKALYNLDKAISKTLGIKNPEKILEKLYQDLISELDRSETIEDYEEPEARSDEEKIIQHTRKEMVIRKRTKTPTGYIE